MAEDGQPPLEAGQVLDHLDTVLSRLEFQDDKTKNYVSYKLLANDWSGGALNILKHLGYVVDGKATPNRR